jgi:hypothetical protein
LRITDPVVTLPVTLAVLLFISQTLVVQAAEYGYPISEVPLPAYSGWARYVSPTGASILGCDGEQVFVSDGASAAAYDVETGVLNWTAAETGSFLLLTADALYLLAGSTSICIESTTGSIKWRMQAATVVGAFDNYVWATGSQEHDPRNIAIDVLLLDAATGSVVRKFETPEVFAWSQGQIDTSRRPWRNAVSPALVVQTVEGVECYTADKVLWRLPALPENHRLELCVTPEGFLAAETFDLLLLSGDEWEQYEAQSAARQAAGELSEFTFKLLDADTGATRWAAVETYGFDAWAYGLDADALTLCGDLFSIKRREAKGYGDLYTSVDTFDFYQLSSGAHVHRIDSSSDLSLQGSALWVDGQMLFPGGIAPTANGLIRIDVPSGEVHAATLPQYLQLGSADFGPSIALCTAEVRNVKSPYSVAPTILFGLNMTDEFDFIAGSLVEHNFPVVDSALAQRFLAASNPGTDAELMRALLLDGGSALAELLPSYSELSPPQRDALLRTVVATGDDYGDYGFYPLMVLDEILRRQTVQADAAQLIRWYEAFPELQDGLRGVIAIAGGPLAADFLADKFTLPDPEPYATPKPPFLDKPYSDGSLPNWPAVEHEGQKYAVFEARGLAGDDLYIGQYAPDSHGFKQVWPTGLTNTFAWNPYDYDEAALALVEPLRLRFEEDELVIGHNSPVLGPNQWNPEFESVIGQNYIESRLSWAELRRDSDRDGLTDISERLMLLDPGVADTDADQIPDAMDVCPNANPATYGRLERGIARLLALHPYDSVQQPDFPFQTIYLLLSPGIGPLQYEPAYQHRVISLHTDALRMQFNKLSEHSYAENTLGITVTPLQENGKTILDARSYGIADNSLLRGEFLVEVSMGRTGFIYELANVEGELYPTGLLSTWIAD